MGAKEVDSFCQFSQQALLERGIVELLMTSDDAKHMLKGYIEGGINSDSF